ncbi:ABC transporter substrate-binding protein [Alkalihalobacillus sp. AL-G]|uniref:peptide ABC transporter substrate-binding protein n=1 Tax=Alkalihalobacillus sp. AL-G TaxID=2926399 RepID=UPI002729DF5A|nr:peptide ABC transporter substrate-binding protein [Alkalihalobacillus sp. AL-G]WLD92027.1 peptide ABC transporter substrate-binding protein [Alkalihalobacillus sp. AL-G]
MKLKSRYSIIVFLIIISLLVTACSNQSSGTTDSNEQEDNTSSTEQKITLNAFSEPSSIDPALIDNQVAGNIANQLFEGLVRIDENGEAAPGVAEDWTISDDGTVYTFNLNPDAKWSNGDPVTAEDFVYSWERTLLPEVAAPLGSNLFFIKNGASYNEGTITDPSKLGLKAIDEHTLEVTLERPTPFFLGLTAFFTLLPINKEVAESNPEWASNAATFVSNGPFKLKSWKHDQELVLVPNEHYWAKDLVKLDEINYVMVSDQNTEFSMFKSGELDVASQIPNTIKSKMIQDGTAQTLPSASLSYLRFNHENDIMKNANIRKALSMALNRELLTEKVTKGGEIPAYAFIPFGLSSGDGEFRKLTGNNLYKDNNPDKAKELLEKGLEEIGESELPTITLLFYTSDIYNQLAQAMQEMWKQNLGVEVELKTMERKVFVDNVKGGQYQIAIYSTGADYDDAQNLMGQFTTGDVYNYSRISIPEYDALMEKADKELNLEKRAQYMVQAEKVLLEKMAIAPLYYRTQVYLQQDNLKNVHRFTIQAVDYREAYVE